jgi:hypothetical protein
LEGLAKDDEAIWSANDKKRLAPGLDSFGLPELFEDARKQRRR